MKAFVFIKNNGIKLLLLVIFLIVGFLINSDNCQRNIKKGYRHFIKELKS